MTPYERRNQEAREAGYRNYYEQRQENARKKHGQNISTSQARGHAAKGEVSLTTLSDVRRVLKDEGKKAAFDYASDMSLHITHDQWSLIFGSPKLRSHARRR